MYLFFLVFYSILHPSFSYTLGGNLFFPIRNYCVFPTSSHHLLSSSFFPIYLLFIFSYTRYFLFLFLLLLQLSSPLYSSIFSSFFSPSPHLFHLSPSFLLPPQPPTQRQAEALLPGPFETLQLFCQTNSAIDFGVKIQFPPQINNFFHYFSVKKELSFLLSGN